MTKDKALARGQTSQIPQEDPEGSANEILASEGVSDYEAERSVEPKGNRLQLFTPSSMLQWGQFEAKFFQQLYTQKAFFDVNGDAVDEKYRSNYYSGIGNFVLGYNSHLNFGVDFWVQSVYLDSTIGSPFNLFSGNRGPWGRTALTAIGPKVKWQPISSLNNFTVQSSFLLPIAKNSEGEYVDGQIIVPYLATKNYLWWTQVFYTNNLSAKLQLFAEVDFYWNIDRRFDLLQSGFIAIPATLFLSYFPTSKITFYTNSQFWPTLGEGVVSTWWWQAGLGGKYQFNQNFDLELSVGRFLAGRGSAGPATVFNLGLRFVKW